MRYAIYFTPPADDPLTRLAAEWLGRDPFNNEALEQPAIQGFSADAFKALTSDARRYGFHATMKAPFSLADGRTEVELIAALEDFSAGTSAFTLPELVLGQIGRFFALVPGDWNAELQMLADDCVSRFDSFRKPLSESDFARRKPDQLTPEQRENLVNWGYPYVFGDFRFHMTLTAQVEPADQPAMRAAIESFFGDYVAAPRRIGHLALFVEPERGAPFILKHIVQLPEPAIRKTA
jgi:putative phosphonate metabolism protein